MVGFGLTVTFTLSVAVQPFESVTVTTYVVVVVGLTDLLVPVPPGGFGQLYVYGGVPLVAFTVNNTDCPVQISTSCPAFKTG